MKKLILLAVAAILAFSLIGCTKTPVAPEGDGAAAATKLVVATDAPYPPMEMVKEDGTFEGFDIELFEAIAADQGYELEFRTSGFDALIAAMGAGTGGDFDAAISSITITPERAENMLFSNPYFDANQSLAVPGGSDVKTTDDIVSGKRVAVQTGTTGEIWARENLEPKGIEIKGYALIPDCFGAMLAGDVDAVVADFQVAADYAKDPARDAKIVQQIETGEEYGIAFPKGSEAHVDAINEGLKAVVADGTYTTIYQKWFGVEPARLP